VQTYLVTGGAGFVGSHLCDRLLAEGKRVIAIDDLSQGRIANLSEARGYDKQFGLVNMDVRVESLRAEFERERPEVVMHLAAQVSVTASVSDPAHDASVNLMGLLNVLEAAAATGARKVVFAASGGTLYGDVRRFPVKETARRGSHPVSPYGISKKAAEDYLAFYQRTRGLDYTSLALANVYGPRQDPHGEAGVVAIFSSKMLAGEPPTIFGDGEQTRDFVYVDDAVDAFARAAERGSGALANIGTAVETSVNEVFRLLGRSLGYRGQAVHAPPRAGELLRSALDPSLAERELGWKPWTSIKDGLKATADAFRTAAAGS
jgi:UDP-glucose 4-epimerase